MTRRMTPLRLRLLAGLAAAAAEQFRGMLREIERREAARLRQAPPRR